MLTYEDLPIDIKMVYSKEQCEQLIVVTEKLSIFMKNFMEALRKIVQAMQPQVEDLLKRYREINESLKEDEVFNNDKVQYYSEKYMPYKVKVKQIRRYRKIIYYHIRDNC